MKNKIYYENFKDAVEKNRKKQKQHTKTNNSGGCIKGWCQGVVSGCGARVWC